MKRSIIESIGLSTPDFKYAQDEIYSFMAEAHELNLNEKKRLKKIYEGSGIEFRYSVLQDYNKTKGDFLFYGNESGLEPFPGTRLRSSIFEKESIPLAIKAYHNCIQSLPDFDKHSITHLITVTCTGLHAPGLDIELVEALGLRPETERMSINFMGCYAAFNALKAADYIVKSDSENRVLIVHVELCTLHFQKENFLQNWISNALFGDGSAAVLVSSPDKAHKNSRSMEIHGFYNLLFLEGKKEMSWAVGNHGFEMNLGTHVSKKIKSSIKSVANNLLAKHHTKFQEIEHFAIHPGGRRILEVAEDELGFHAGPEHPSYKTLRNYGNLSSATIFFVLAELMDQIHQKNRNPGKIMSFAFGPGLSFESLLLESLS